jgi:KEOPS complex subunit Pcc1
VTLLVTGAVVRLPFQSKRELAALVDALQPEIQRQIGVRSKVSLNVEDLTLVLSVEATDTVALRAALNSYLRWINSTTNVLQTLAKKP